MRDNTAVALRPSKYLSDVTDIREYLARFKLYTRASNIRDEDWANVDLLMSYLRMELDKKNIWAEEAMTAIIKELDDVSPKSKARAKMYEETQREGERMSDFATRVAEKALKAYEDEGMRRTAQLDVFVMGVRDNERPEPSQSQTRQLPLNMKLCII